MTGTIQVITEKGEAIVEKHFMSRLSYMFLLAEVLENFRSHRIEITFQSAV